MESSLINTLLVTSLLMLSVNARGTVKRDVDKVCPGGSSGVYPRCECANGSQYNEVHNECPPKSLESLAGSCPSDSTGVFPNCACRLGKVYDHEHSICLDIDRTKCPKRSVGSPPHCKCEEGYKLDNIHWYCRAWYLDEDHRFNDGPIQQCPVFHLWDGSKCEPIRCPNNRELLFPHCVDTPVDHNPTSCPPGQNYTIEKPYCHCPLDQDYTFPICHERCPANTYFDLKSKSCGKRPCPPGWIGDYYPHCSVKNYQKCPDEFPGQWPNCNIYDEGPRLEDRKRKVNYV
ncbi:uncharacterized protein LOC129564810 [Sitodiplosis mosellana]|uniref:uncharacterized protein LOC129564810 n=1 Tax=Sitodiplosis mosellana TaxID=263140 RepID=UPI0024449D8B|nr:uncharacterized protein LOC129564810 [Sitodiplosis mosellana]